MIPGNARDGFSGCKKTPSTEVSDVIREAVLRLRLLQGRKLRRRLLLT